MAFVVGSCSVADFDAWQQQLMGGVLAGAGGVVSHTVYRGTTQPEAVVVVIELGTAEQAEVLRTALTASGLLGGSEAALAVVAAHARHRPPEGPFPHVH